MSGRTYTHNEKVTALYGYLVEGGTMVEVAQRYDLPNERGFGVSDVTKSYGFSGKNSGVFGRSGKFCKRHGFIPNWEDISRYVQTYPNGVGGDGYTMLENFLLANKTTSSINGYSDPFKQQNHYSDEEIAGEIIGGVGGCILIIGIIFLLWKLFF